MLERFVFFVNNGIHIINELQNLLHCQFFIVNAMDFEKVKEKVFEDAYKGNIDLVMKAIEEHLRLLKEVDIVSNNIIYL